MCHFEGRFGEFATPVQGTPAARLGLFRGFDDEDAVDDRNPGLNTDLMEGRSGAFSDEVMVLGIAREYKAKRDDGIVFAGAREEVRGVGQFIGTGDTDDLRLGGFELGEGQGGIFKERRDQVFIKACRGDADTQFMSFNR